MIATFLSRMFLGSQARRRAVSRPLWNLTSAMESRTLLAGNVTAALVGGDLQLNGDAAGNDIKISKTTAGIIVQGLNGTTINGATTDFVAYPIAATSNGSITATLGAGNDKIQLDGIDLDDVLSVDGGTGDDSLGLTSTAIHGRVVFTGGAGKDTFFGETSTIDGNLNANMGGGNDLLTLRNTEVKGDVTSDGGDGADRLALDAVTIGGSLRAGMGKGNDDIRIANGTQIQRVFITGGQGADLVQINDSTISRSLSAKLGRGNDSLTLGGTTSVQNRIKVRGGRGRDVVEVGTATLPDRKRFRSTKSGTVSAALLTARITSPTTGLLAAVETTRSGFIAPTGTITSAIAGTGIITTATGLVSNKTTVNVSITGTAGQMVQIDKNGDGFNDGSATLDSTGQATIAVALANTTTVANAGLNSIRVQQAFNGAGVGPIQTLAVQYTNTLVVRMATSLGNVDIELFADDTPKTVQNFVNYLARYQGSIIHRSAHGAANAPFIVQGGGFDLIPPLTAITTDAAIINEFKAIHSNARGTLSMAQLSGNINSGTSQWFFNSADNNSNAAGVVNLDSVPHTVFGRVQGTGMTVVDAIHALTSYNLQGPLTNSALGEVPLDATYVPFTGTVAGTVSVTTGTRTVTGVGTTFSSALRSGAAVQINGTSYTVDLVTSNTQFTILENATATVTDGAATLNTTPLDSQYVRITSVSVIPQLV